MVQTKNKYEDEYVLHEIKDGILFTYYKNGLEINLSIAKKILASRLNFTNNKSYITLIDGRYLKSLDWGAREFFASKEAQEGIKAAALLSGSKLTSYIGNFFLKITYKPRSVPAKLFTNKEKALQWLEQYK